MISCKGAFTGADRERKGAFEVADGGTLFLDEIGECDLETQAKLLRVLQPVLGEGSASRRVCRLGEERDRTVNVRVIAATNRNLYEAIEHSSFRDDLYYRLAAVSITLPPLRERKSDIPRIAEHLLGQINRQFEQDEFGYKHKSFSDSAIAFMKTNTWPGNVRQLYNAIVQAAVLTDNDHIGRNEMNAAIGELPNSSGPKLNIENHPLGDGFDLQKHLQAIQISYLQHAMQEAHGNKSEAARLLGMKHYQTLDQQLKRLGVNDKTDKRS